MTSQALKRDALTLRFVMPITPPRAKGRKPSLAPARCALPSSYPLPSLKKLCRLKKCAYIEGHFTVIRGVNRDDSYFS